MGRAGRAGQTRIDAGSCIATPQALCLGRAGEGSSKGLERSEPGTVSCSQPVWYVLLLLSRSR